ncbi:MAG TPA: hypothetical protein VJZ71_05990 [Phycisphaerae bacterium]|nr:hypothetical protein [Phycisphaerae bacterium]
MPTIQPWLAVPEGQPTVGGFLFVTLASVAAGMLVSSLRWMLVDTVHHRTGIKPPKWDFSILEANLAAYNILVEFHYRYYQFNANTFIAVGLGYLVRLAGGCPWCGGFGWTDFGFVMVEAVLLAASRDALRKYYERVSQVLRSAESRRKGDSHDERRRTRTRMGSGVGDAGTRKEGPGREADRGEEAGLASERHDGEE